MSELRIQLDIPDLEIISQAINNKGEIILSVRSLKTETPCHKCGKPATIRGSFGFLVDHFMHKFQILVNRGIAAEKASLFSIFHNIAF